MIAKEFYMLQQEVESLEKDLHSASQERKEELEEQLRRARAERDRMRRMLEGNKEPSPYRKPK
jgi:ribosomal protein L32E